MIANNILNAVTQRSIMSYMALKNRLYSACFPEKLAARAITRIPITAGVVLMYHEVLPDEVKLPAWTIVRESEFRWQIDFLRAHFDVVTMDEALERVVGSSCAKRPFAVVTLDDGYKGNREIVLPIMESRGLPFIVYVATMAVIKNELYWHDRIINLLQEKSDIHINLQLDGQREEIIIKRHASDRNRWTETQRLLGKLKLMTPATRETAVQSIMGGKNTSTSVIKMLTVEDLKHLSQSSNVTIGAHTHRHELLDQLTIEDVWETLTTANREIYRITGTAPNHFAYPNGNHNSDICKILKDVGYLTAVTTVHGIWSNFTGLLNIPRFGIGRFTSRGQFKAVLSGYL